MVERVSHVLPQLQVTVMVRYSGWIFGFIRSCRWFPRKGRIILKLAAAGKRRSEKVMSTGDEKS
jgi:hypothetical protein